MRNRIQVEFVLLNVGLFRWRIWNGRCCVLFVLELVVFGGLDYFMSCFDICLEASIYLDAVAGLRII